ncbi:F-box/LRR-repeat protein [Trifolium pratense]|uniref:F-box/LRR-repeat protein n=1 Tax=Trifolium pratense TaxID=57577 RepID=A0A2K3L397_TRIPR|nr:F-box/LRR-repeat protein [Trifolium pratense]
MHRILFPNSLHLPALTILALQSFYFSVDNDGHVEPFSALKRLKSLILYECGVMGAQNLCISSTTLVRLRVSSHLLVRPSTYFGFGIVLSTPSLREFHFKGLTLPKLCESKSNLPNITHVSINFMSLYHSVETPLVLHKWLVELANTQSLSVNSPTLKILSLVPDLLKSELPSLDNLKSLKVEMSRISIPDGIVNFLCRKSRSAKVDIIGI